MPYQTEMYMPKLQQFLSSQSLVLEDYDFCYNPKNMKEHILAQK